MDALLLTHIVGGFTALATGPVAMLARKGAPAHVGWGRAYGIAMLAVALTSLALGVLKHREFLVFVGLFTLQVLVSGYRALAIRRGGISRFDGVFQAVALAMGVGFVAWGILALNRGDLFGFLAIGFGGASAGLAARWIGLLRARTSDRGVWLRHHLIGMAVGYVSTLTAALVVNDRVLPYALGWTLPTALGVPLIVLAARRVRTRPAAPVTG